MDHQLTTMDYKMLKYIKKHPCSSTDLPAKFGRSAEYRFNLLRSNGYTEPESYDANQTDMGSLVRLIQPAKTVKLSPKGLFFLENHKITKIEIKVDFVKREIITIITSVITSIIISLITALITTAIIS